MYVHYKHTHAHYFSVYYVCSYIWVNVSVCVCKFSRVNILFECYSCVCVFVYCYWHSESLITSWFFENADMWWYCYYHIYHSKTNVHLNLGILVMCNIILKLFIYDVLNLKSIKICLLHVSLIRIIFSLPFQRGTVSLLKICGICLILWIKYI